MKQIHIISSLRNEIRKINIYSDKEKDLKKLENYLNKIQNIREPKDYFKNIQIIGEGKFGKVILSEHLLTNKKVAIKIIQKSSEEEQEETFKCAMWENEISKFLINIKNKNIEKIYDIYEYFNLFYFITEYIPNGDLQEFIIKNPYGFPKDINFFNTVTNQLIKGISTLHKYGIIHRDIKHTNTLIKFKKIQNDNNYNNFNKSKSKSKSRKNIGYNNYYDKFKNFYVKIIDFGLGKFMGYNDYAYEYYGSLTFKSPELIMAEKYNFNVDVWALGILIYFMIYQKYPFIAESKNLLMKKIVNMTLDKKTIVQFGNYDDYVNKIMMLCLVKDPKNRPSSLYLSKLKIDEYD